MIGRSRDRLCTRAREPAVVGSERRRAGEQESRRAGEQESRRAGEQESRRAGEQESRRAGEQCWVWSCYELLPVCSPEIDNRREGLSLMIPSTPSWAMWRISVSVLTV